uniref:HYR domain-containing protein n=1 Tax=Chaetoceros debilis TaxID=122233 RepID=A0A7S3Q1U2_9STRA
MHFALHLSALLGVICLTSLFQEGQSHGVEVAYCHTPTGKLRIWVEHWHGTEVADPVSGAGTMLIRDNLAPGTPSTEVTADGFVRDIDSGSLPGCGTPSTETLVAACNKIVNPQDNWVYFDYPISCNVPVDVTLLQGTTVILETGCGTTLYPATISQTFLDAASPVLFVDGLECAGGISPTINASVNSCADKANISFEITTTDDCDPNPTLTVDNTPGLFSVGTTVVTATSQDIRGNISTCAFDVVVAGPTTCSTSEPSISATPSSAPSINFSSVPTSNAQSSAPSTQPSIPPSTQPSSVPSIAPTRSSAPSATPQRFTGAPQRITGAPVPIYDHCQDSPPTLRFKMPYQTLYGTRKTCQWVQRLQISQPNLVWKRCNISGLNGNSNLSVANFCPKSCATCGPCRNSYERFVIPNSPGKDSIRKSCNWVTRVRNTKPNLWFKRCEIDIVKEMCPNACELC